MTAAGPISSGFTPALHWQQAVPRPCSVARGGQEGAHSTPTPTASRCIRGWQQQPGPENSLGQARGLERGWPGQHLEAATGGAGLVQSSLSKERPAKALRNRWKLKLFFSEFYTLARFGKIFFHRSSKRNIFDIRVTTSPVFMALLQTTQALELHKCL